MAVYDFKCGFCGDVRKDVVLPMTHTQNDRPACCGFRMDVFITAAPMVHWKHYEFENGGFKTISAKRGENEVITTHRQHENYLKKHDLRVAEAPPPTVEQDARTRAEIQASIDAITPSPEVARQLDIVE